MYEGVDRATLLPCADAVATDEQLPSLEDELRAIYDRAWPAFSEMMSPEAALALYEQFGFLPDDPEFPTAIAQVIEDNVIMLVDGWREGSEPKADQMCLILAFFDIDRNRTHYDQSDYDLVMARDEAHSAKMDAICERMHAHMPADQTTGIDLPLAATPAEDRVLGLAYLRDRNAEDEDDEDDEDDLEPAVVVH